MRRLILAAAIGVGGLVVPMSSAQAGCGNTIDIAGLVYVNDSPLLWVYVETNGAPGLQQGGSSLAGEAAPCSDDHPNGPDTLVV